MATLRAVKAFKSKTHVVKETNHSKDVSKVKLQWVTNPTIVSAAIEIFKRKPLVKKMVAVSDGPKIKRKKKVEFLYTLSLDDSIRPLSSYSAKKGNFYESRPSTKDTKSSKKSESLKPGKPSKSPNRAGKDKGRKEYADASMQDEGGDSSKAFIEKSNEASRQPTRQSKNLEPVMEGDEFPNSFELDDEDSWSNVPSQHIPGRFLQYRRLTMSKLKELEDQLQVTLTKTHRKVNSLKSQFNEHKTKWESERKILIEQVEQAQKLQTDAEKEADAAMTQLEEFINEQEKLEDEEEQKRQEIIKSMSRPGTVKQMTPAPMEPKPVTPDAKPVEQAEALPNDQSEQELTNLMQQTDDAKSRAGSARASSRKQVSSRKESVSKPGTSLSNTIVTPSKTGTIEDEDKVESESEGSPVAPWLTPAYLRGETEKKRLPSNQTSESRGDGASRLTSQPESELQQLTDPDNNEAEVVASSYHGETDDVKGQMFPPIEGIKGEREVLMSRTSTKLTKLPNIRSTSQLSEKYERAEGEATPWFLRPEKPKIEVQYDSPEEVDNDVFDQKESEQNLEVAKGVEAEKSQIKKENEKKKVPEPVLTHTNLSFLPSFDTKQEVNKQSDRAAKFMKKAPKSKFKVEQKKIYAAYKKNKAAEKERKALNKAPAEEVKVKPVRRTSSAKIPKEIVEKLGQYKVGRLRRARSSFAMVNEMDSPDISDAESIEQDIIDLDVKKPDLEDGVLEEKDLERKVSSHEDTQNIDNADTKKLEDNDQPKAEDIIKEKEASPKPVEVEMKVVEIGDAEMKDIKTDKEILKEEIVIEETDGTVETEQTGTEQTVEPDIDNSMERKSKDIADEELDVVTPSGRLTGSKSLTDVLPSQPSRNTVQQSRLTLQSLQSVSLEGLDSDEDGDVVEDITEDHGNDTQKSDQSRHPRLIMIDERPVVGAVEDDERHVVTVNVLHTPLTATSLDSEAQKNSRNAGVVSAPPTVEQTDMPPRKQPEISNIEEDNESSPLTVRNVTSASMSGKKVVPKEIEGPISPPKEAFKTPRSARNSEISDDVISVSTDPDEGVAMEITQSQSEALNTMKSLMDEENMTFEQQKTLDSLRSAIRSLSSERKLRDIQLERTVTILSLASQIARESVELGILPDGVFDGFAKMDSRSISVLSDETSVFVSSAVSRKKSSVIKKASAENIQDHLKATEQTDTDLQFNLVKQPRNKTAKSQRGREKTAESLKSIKKEEKPKEAESSANNEPKVELKKEKTKLSKTATKLEKELTMSSDFTGCSPDLASSFSASLPRTLTSSEWRKMSPHDPHSISAEMKQKMPEEPKEEKVIKMKEITEKQTTDLVSTGTQSDLTMEDIANAETRMSGISVVISPKKKTRPVTMEQMLYGESSSKTNGDITTNEVKENVEKPVSRARSRTKLRPKSETDQQLQSGKLKVDSGNNNNHYKITESDYLNLQHTNGTLLNLSLSNTEMADFKLDLKATDSLVTDNNNDEHSNIKCSITGPINYLTKSEVLPDTANSENIEKAPSVTASQEFDDIKLMSKKISEKSKTISEKSETIPAKSGKVLEMSLDQSRPLVSNKGPCFHHLDDFKLKGHKILLRKEFPNFGQKGFTKESKYSKDCTKVKSNTVERILNPCLHSESVHSQYKSINQLLGNKNKYNVKFSVFGDSLAKLDLNKSPSKHALLPSPRESSNLVVMTTDIENDLEFESKVKFNTEPSPPSGLDHSDNTNSSHGHSPKSPNSIGPQKLSAKSKHSVFESEVSAHSVIPLPNSPSTNGRISPVTVNRSPRTSATPGTMVSDIQRPVSISSVQPKFPETPPPYIIYNPSKETQTDDWLSQLEREPVKGNSEEEVRQSSAKSRASLRNQFKSRLDETRHAVEERRTKSPVITVPAQKSIEDELIIDDDDDDLPIPDDQKEFFKEDTLDAGTSPPPGRRISLASRKSTKLGEHPVVQEYLRAYTGIHNFKEAMSRVLIDKEQMSASQILTDLDKLPFDKDGAVVAQVSNMTENIYYVLNEVSQVVNSVLQNDRGPVVSSLMMGMSRDATQRTINREKSGMTVDFHPDTRGSQRTVSKAGSMSIDAGQYQELQAQYEKLQNQMADDGKKYEDQQRHNVVVMMEMQDTINQLQRELSSLGKQNRQATSGSASALGNQNPDSAIMFTRLDSERNAKIMKKAVNEKKLDTDKYKEAMVQMDEYVNLPAQRLAHLVKKYVHHCRMKEIEENVQKSQSLNENVFELFDKMEALQNQRAKRWANRMDEMGMERYRLANMLMETLDCIEQESGIFLIKPMYSYRGREQKDHQYGGGKITRPFRPHRTLSPLRDSSSAQAPAPTPASNMRLARHQARKEEPSQYPQDAGQVQYVPKGPLEGDSTGLMGATVNYVGAQPRATWNMADSQIGMYSPTMGNVNTPRILELDINRMMIGQNTISAQIGSPGLSNDRLVNAANNNLRSYMTVNRPGPNSAGKNDRPSSGSRHSPLPSSSPTNQSASTAKRVRLSDADVPTVMSASQPLPPIGVTDRPRSSSSKGRQSPPRIPVGNDLPESPPGSSLRQSPVQDADVISPIK
ncbi:hypothetical protein ACF0H5_024155 [Mactra antiquata]